MNAALLRHAIANVWCQPGQDKQFVYQLVHLSPHRPIQTPFTLGYETIPLPETGSFFHVFQIGQVLPKNIGLPTVTRQWMKLSDLMTEHLLFSEVYTRHGLQFPRFQTYVWLTPSRNLIIAVKENRMIYRLERETVFLRLYSNAFFRSERSSGRRAIHYKGMVVDDTDTLLAFQRDARLLVEEKGGYGYHFVNGRFCHNVSIVTAGMDDVVEFILDESVKRMVEFDIIDQPTFTSTRDQARKYILHHEQDVESIEYLDDIDAFMINPGINERFMGVGYHRNHPMWMRMLTHRDYSVPVERFKAFVEIHPTDPRHQVDPVKWSEDDWTSVEGKKLRLYIRDSGYERPLIPNANRIQELYRLDHDRILMAMRGTDSTVSVWKAENLEDSPYVRFMGLSPDQVHPITYNRLAANHPDKIAMEEFVGDMYGYHATATILANTPSEVYQKDSFRYADLAHEHRENATVFEYDANGLLLDWYYHTAGDYHLVKNSDCVLVEAIGGRGTKRAKTHYGTDNIELTKGYNFRVYVRDKQFGVPINEWRDITEADDRHEWGFLDNLNGEYRWVWTKSSAAFHGAVREDTDFLCYNLTLVKNDGHLRFTLEHDTQDEEGDWGSVTPELPYRQLDVILNGHQLIEGIDYRTEWPEVVLSHKEYLLPGDAQYLTIRHYGLQDRVDKHGDVTEYGFVRQGVLSRDGEYDIHTHKIRRIITDGRYRQAKDVVYDEQLTQYTIDDVRNGVPYMIQTPPIIFKDVYVMDQAARDKDQAIDKEVRDYMSEYFPVTEYDHPNYLERKYQLISPFANKLLHDLKEGWFYPDGIEGHYSEQKVREWCKEYEWLLPFDPANEEYNKVHLNIRPHWHDSPVMLNIIQYQFFYRALQSYLRYPPDLSPYITVS